MEYIFTSIFCFIFFLLAFFAKKYLYTNEHEASILKEVEQFDKNIKAINKIDLNNYEMNSDHLYHN